MFKIAVKSWMKGMAAVAIAYVLAIQLIFTAAISTQMVVAPADVQTICHDALGSPADDERKAPVQSTDHEDKCRICVFATAASAALPGAASIPLVWLFSQTTILAVASSFELTARLHEPRSSQGPPGIV